jgi:hypothetical protein
MTRPDGIISVEPKAVATYTAMCWIGDDKDPALLWMAERYGWKIAGMRDSLRKGRALMIVGKNNKRYLVAHGDYIIALGANGSLRVATVKEFDSDYREASA